MGKINTNNCPENLDIVWKIGTGNIEIRRINIDYVVKWERILKRIN